ncbi:zinc finger protein 830-like [Crassostrea angulata]|uniref:zinc finger protein 830-like n=1 Tax=Magallana angulata TaxID=2784310 RepID=UPI0022B088C8|nr:zinc finger protein 830-like [Crassostrea angulata]
MASKSKTMKKAVSKEDLKRLMKEKQASKDNKTKVTHPLAKYNTLDQLVCVLCNTVIKSNILWNAHIQGRQHKEKLAIKSQPGPAKPPDPGIKRKSEFLEPAIPQKKQKENGNSSKKSNSLPSDFFDNKPKSSGRQQNSLGLSSYSSDEEEEDEDEGKGREVTPTSAASSLKSVQLSHPALPADFFDPGVKKEEIKEEKPKTMADILPEGFFDNPKADAKVRQVEYKDKLDEEWEMFQRAIKEENHVSEAIMDEEDEIVNVERNIDEIDDQINRWKEINDLEIKKEEIMQKKTSEDIVKEQSDDEDVEDEDLEDFMDWRSKTLK